jgi:hypothetical protein
MPSSPDNIARRAAQRLGEELHVNMPAAVEAQLHTGKPPERYEPVTLAIALASLVVSASKAVWDVYHDVKKDRKEAPAREVAARRLRLELTLDENLSIAQRDKVIAAVLDEIENALRDRS